MSRVIEYCSQINSKTRNYPERLRVVRSASVWPEGVRLRSSAFITNDSGCWRPGMRFDEARPVNALDALRRHAEAHELYEHEQARKVRRAA